jgi:50S ribosomal subunit-associated GTPase HflX
MAKIHDLTNDQEEILNLLFCLDESDEQDKEQIEYLNKKLNLVRGSAESTILFLNKIYMEARDISEKRKEAKIKAQKRQTTAENAAERLKNRIIEICEVFDVQKVIDEDDGVGVRTQLSPGSIKYAEDFDYSKLPIHCRKTEIVPINKEVKALIDAGTIIPGVEIVKNLGIRVV